MAPVFRMRYDNQGQRNYIPVWKDGERLSRSSSGCHIIKDDVAPCCNRGEGCVVVVIIIVLWLWCGVVAMALRCGHGISVTWRRPV